MYGVKVKFSEDYLWVLEVKQNDAAETTPKLFLNFQEADYYASLTWKDYIVEEYAI